MVASSDGEFHRLMLLQVKGPATVWCVWLAVPGRVLGLVPHPCSPPASDFPLLWRPGLCIGPWGEVQGKSLWLTREDGPVDAPLADLSPSPSHSPWEEGPPAPLGPGLHHPGCAGSGWSHRSQHYPVEEKISRPMET
ncbi:unnamed protein product [Lepidochelys olivacea]